MPLLKFFGKSIFNLGYTCAGVHDLVQNLDKAFFIVMHHPQFYYLEYV
jgi:hypothetical protein